MGWSGYATFDGTEIINATRTEVLAAGKPWFKAAVNNPVFEEANGEEGTYSNILNAPWWDPDEPASERFYGLYPISITGIEDSSRTSAVVESTEDGGVPGRVRHGIKPVLFNVIIVAEDTLGAEYGMRWARRALLGAVCSPLLSTQTSLGATLGYLAAEPVYEPDPSMGQGSQMPALQRTLRRVTFNSGPSVLAKADNLSCGGSAWNIQFGGVAANPYEYGAERAIIQGYMDPSVGDPWVPGVVAGAFSTSATSFSEVNCGDNLWDPIYDPLCPALIIPPGPPSIPLGCYDPPASWSRRQITVPAANIPTWGEVVPILEFSATTAIRNTRIRFYKDPDGTFDPDDFPCDFIGDAVITYIPASGSIVFDGVNKEIAVITAGGQRRRADSLVFRTDGKPFQWPALTCGYQHILTIDVEVGGPLPVLDLSLVARAL